MTTHTEVHTASDSHNDIDEDVFVEPVMVCEEFLLDRTQYINTPNELGIPVFDGDTPNCYWDPEWFALHFNLTGDDLRTIASRCHVTEVVAGIAQRPDVPDDVWNILLARPSEGVRHAVLNSPFAPDTARVAAYLIGPRKAGMYSSREEWIEDYLPEGESYEYRWNEVELPVDHPEYWRHRGGI